MDIHNLGTIVNYILEQRGVNVASIEPPVVDDGSGPKITRWDEAWGAQPTQQELDDAEAAALASVTSRRNAKIALARSGYTMQELIAAIINNDTAVLNNARTKMSE